MTQPDQDDLADETQPDPTLAAPPAPRNAGVPRKLSYLLVAFAVALISIRWPLRFVSDHSLT